MDFGDAAAAFDCVRAERAELQAAISDGNAADMEEELGDLLFSCVNTARHLGIDAEQALTKATNKFIDRFAATEALVAAQNLQMPDLTLEELDVYWEDAKASSRQET